MENFDVIIIGAGPGGYEAAAFEAAHGRKTALIERDELGGTCLNRGCIPTKTFCRSAETALEIAGADAFGIHPAGGAAFQADIRAIVERKNGVVAALRQGVEMATAKAEVLRGEARLTGSHEVKVTLRADDGSETFRHLSAPKIVIATGSEPAWLPIPGKELCVSSTELLDLRELPKSLAVIGGGVIGMEFASIFSALGVEVTVVEYCKEILPPFDKDIAKRLRTALAKRGISFFVAAEVKAVEGTAEGPKTLRFVQKGKELTVEAQVVLMAVGRRPVVPEGCVEAGIEVGRRGVVVNDRFETAVEGVYAIGDCNGRCMLAHAASAQAALVAGERVNLAVVPSAVFTVPECAMVGQTEEALKAAGVDYRAVKLPMRSNGKALAMGEADGMIKLIIDTATRQILGCHICAPHASDLVAETALAMAAALPLEAVTATIHSHPSLSEALLAAARSLS